MLRHVATVTQLLLQASVPSEVQPWLCRARPVAFPRPSGDLRPVAVGELWRRLVGKVGSLEVAAEARDFLESLQLDVGTKHGAEALVHSVRQWLGRNRNSADKLLVTLDLENAFNSVDRSAFLASLRRFSPQLAPWADFCYKQPSVLLLADKRIDSSRGIQQGDPMGALLFALAIHKGIEHAKAVAHMFPLGGLDFVAF